MGRSGLNRAAPDAAVPVYILHIQFWPHFPVLERKHDVVDLCITDHTWRAYVFYYYRLAPVTRVHRLGGDLVCLLWMLTALVESAGAGEGEGGGSGGGGRGGAAA